MEQGRSPEGMAGGPRGLLGGGGGGGGGGGVHPKGANVNAVHSAHYIPCYSQGGGGGVFLSFFLDLFAHFVE